MPTCTPSCSVNPAPVADFQALMQAVQFGSTSENPTNFGANPTRTLGWGLHDGDDYTSPAQFTQIVINAIDDPAVAQNDAVATTENTAIAAGNVFVNNGFGPDGDPDGGAFAVTAVSGGTVGTPVTLPSGALLIAQRRRHVRLRPQPPVRLSAGARLGRFQPDHHRYLQLRHHGRRYGDRDGNDQRRRQQRRAPTTAPASTAWPAASSMTSTMSATPATW